MDLPEIAWMDESGRMVSIFDRFHNADCKVYPSALMRRPPRSMLKPIHSTASPLAMAEASKPFQPFFGPRQFLKGKRR